MCCTGRLLCGVGHHAAVWSDVDANKIVEIIIYFAASPLLLEERSTQVAGITQIMSSIKHNIGDYTIRKRNYNEHNEFIITLTSPD
jgi:hypothetical protein